MNSADSSSHSHYFDADPDSTSERSSVDLTLPDASFTLATDAGVFGRTRVDPGTKFLLLDGPEAHAGDQELADVGAGYGPIALTLAHRNPSARVWAIEVNARARRLCSENAQSAGLNNLEVVTPEQVPAEIIFDRVWSNPPIRVGKAALHELLLLWLERLSPTGSAHLVVQKHLGSDSLQRWLEAQGWSASRRGSRAGYRLLDVAPATQTEGTP